MPTITEKVEGDYRRQLKVDTVRATALGMTVEKYRSEQAASVKRWATLMHEIMEASGPETVEAGAYRYLSAACARSAGAA